MKFVRTSVVAWMCVIAPGAAWAQTSLTGVVRDTSGAVLPGVTVEASSPVLIEKSRSTVTDGQGLYRIVDLRPGTYAVTFALAGFQTVKREGIELAEHLLRKERHDDIGQHRHADKADQCD